MITNNTTQQQNNSVLPHDNQMRSIIAQQQNNGVESDNLFNNQQDFSINIIPSLKKIVSNTNIPIISYQMGFDNLFKLLEKRTKTISLVFSEIFYLQQHVKDIDKYIEEEHANFLLNDESKHTYEYGYIEGYTYEDIAIICGSTKATISKYFQDFEKFGYVIKKVVTSADIKDFKNKENRKCEERIRIRLNLVKIFKDLIANNINHLEAKANNLSNDFMRLYTDIKHVIMFMNNKELADKYSKVNNVNEIDINILVKAYANMHEKVNTYSAEDSNSNKLLKPHLDKLLKKYKIDDLVLAMENYERYRYMTNKLVERNNKYILSTRNFFGMKKDETGFVVDDFIEENFNDFLALNELLPLSEKKSKKGFKTIYYAEDMLIKRKRIEISDIQIMLDKYCRDLRNNSKISSFKPKFDFGDKSMVDKLLADKETSKKLNKFFNNNFNAFQSKEDFVNMVYMQGLSIQYNNKILSLNELCDNIILELKSTIAQSKRMMSITYSFDGNDFREIEYRNIDDIFANWSFSDIFSMDFGKVKIIKQALFYLSTSCDIGKKFSFSKVLDTYFFDLHNNEKVKLDNLRLYLNYANNYTAKRYVMGIMDKIGECIKKYEEVEDKSICDIISADELLQDNDIALIAISQGSTIELPLNSIFDRDNILNVSQIIDMPALKKKNNNFYNFIKYLCCTN